MEDAGGKRIRTKPDTWAPGLDEGPQRGARRSGKRQAVEAPAALEPDDGLIPVETFLAEVLVAVHSLIQARAQLCLRKPVPPLSELGARTPGSSGATCILDEAVGALRTTIHAVATLPQTGAAPDDGVQYYVSRETYSTLEAEVGQAETVKGRKAALRTLGARAGAILRSLVPQALGGLPLIWKIPDDATGAVTSTGAPRYVVGEAAEGQPRPATPGAGAVRQPSATPATARAGKHASAPLQVVQVLAGSEDTRTLRFVGCDKQFSKAFLEDLQEKVAESVRTRVNELQSSRQVGSAVEALLDGKGAEVAPEFGWLYELLCYLQPRARDGDDRGKEVAAAKAQQMQAVLTYAHDSRLNHFQLVWAVRCRLTGASNRLIQALGAQGIAMPKRTAAPRGGADRQGDAPIQAFPPRVRAQDQLHGHGHGVAHRPGHSRAPGRAGP